ncbi:MAG: helix-turn-helix domain-containing protein, partial [Pseudomonadota bacterium]
ESFPGFAPSAVAAIDAGEWPGNVRELRNFAERLTYRSLSEAPGQPIRFEADSLDPFSSPWRPKDQTRSKPLAPTEPAAEPPTPVLDQPFERQVNQFEMELVDAALTATAGHQGQAAQRLGLTYHQLRGLLRKHGYGKMPGREKPDNAAPAAPEN